MEGWEKSPSMLTAGMPRRTGVVFRLVLAGYTVAELGSLSAGGLFIAAGCWLLSLGDSNFSCCGLSSGLSRSTRHIRQCLEVRALRESVVSLGGAGLFMMGRGYALPGRWDPSHRLYCEGAGWRELRTKLEEIVMNHAGGPILFDRVVFEMATKGEAGCNLVSSPLPRTPEVYEEQTTWKLEMGPNDVAKAWKANYESAAEHIGYVREHFDAEVAEGLMLKLDEDTFWRRYGDEAALSAIAVLVDEGPPRRRGSSMTRLTRSC